MDQPHWVEAINDAIRSDLVTDIAGAIEDALREWETAANAITPKQERPSA